MPTERTFISYGQMNLINSFRSIWLDLAIWTKKVLVAVSYDLPNLDAIFNRLYGISDDFSNLLRLIFGNEAAEGIRLPLSVHFVTLLAIFQAQKDGDGQTVNEKTALLYQNVEDLAEYFSKMNPYWSQSQWRNLLYSYIYLTFQESTALLSGNFELDIDVYDRISDYTSIIGDYTASGVIEYLEVRGAQDVN